MLANREQMRTNPRVLKAVRLAHDDILRVRESPMGSNQGPIVDEYNREFGSPLGSYWCGNALGHWWKGGGLEIPTVPGDVDEWIKFAKKTGRWSRYPVIGAATIYGHGEDGRHCGIVYDFDSIEQVFDIQGNTTLTGRDRNGWLVTGKQVDLSWLLGYVHPFVVK